MTYYEYWGLKKPPFDNVPDPTMYVDCHASMENAIAETLFAIEEGNECVAVIVGDVGLGKTLSIRIIIDSLEQEKYKIALITNPDMTFIELLREIIGQLTGKQCDERRRINLLEVFNKILFETMDAGKKVLVFVDEANAMSPANLESLRLLTNMQDDQRNLFTIVLAGQLELARRLEHPKRANLLQRIGTFSRIDKIESEKLLKAYVETRLGIVGGTRKIFTDEAYTFLWEYSEHGVPRLINKICKLSLKAGETNQFSEVKGEVVHQIGERFQNLTGQAVQKRKPRKRREIKVITEPAHEKPKVVPAEPVVLSVEAFQGRRADESLAEQIEREEKPETVEKEVAASAEVPVVSGLQMNDQADETDGMVSAAVESPETAAVEVVAEHVVNEEPEIAEEPAVQEVIVEPAVVAEPEVAEEPLSTTGDFLEEIDMYGCKIEISIPAYLLDQGRSSTQEHRMKVAGVLAAQVLKKYPDLASSPAIDPISAWSDIREFITAKLK
ncbi:MAG: AAA family ATPase [Syntrophales bacterium]